MKQFISVKDVADINSLVKKALDFKLFDVSNQ